MSSRRNFLTRTAGGALTASLAGRAHAEAAIGKSVGPDPYTRIGVKPFINCTATLTINGGSLTLPEVISTVEQASHYHVDLNELMDKVGDRLAELLQVGWGMVTAGAASSLMFATAGCLVGTDPERIQRLPNLEGLKNEVIMPRESRNVYDHAIRDLNVKIIEVNTPDELRRAISPHTAMVAVLGQHFAPNPGAIRLDLKDVAPIANKAGVPVLIDAAADYLIVPNPYITLGADMVAYSGGKIIRGPQTAGLLIGRRDLVRAAWANSAPHHGFGRTAKVSKEEIVGMLRAVEVWREERDIQADMRLWESWYAEMIPQITKAYGVSAEVHGPIRGGPFPTLNISWDPKQIGLTAGDVGRALLNGEPRIMTQAEGEGHSFVIRPAAMKPGEHKIVARRLFEVFEAAPKPEPPKPWAAPAADISGTWDVEMHYEVGSSRHKLVFVVKGNNLSGLHQGWAYQGDLKGHVDGAEVKFHSAHPADGNILSYIFTGRLSGDAMSGECSLGEYGQAKWRATKLA
jgi:D-glucosaminate-6-phosphate ammonia-lyase